MPSATFFSAPQLLHLSRRTNRNSSPVLRVDSLSPVIWPREKCPMSVPLADLPVQWWLQLQGLQREFSLVSAQNRGSKPFLRLSFNSLAFGTPSFSAPGRTICSVPPLVLTKPCGNECVCVCVCVCVCARAQSLSHVRLFLTSWTVALPGSSVHGISQARILEWVAISSSRASSDPGIEPLSPASSALAGGFLTTEPPGKPHGNEASVDIRFISFLITYLCLC